MAAAQSLEPTPRKPLRVWPGVAAVIVQWIGWFVVPVVLPDAGMAGMMAAIAMTLAIIVWWLFFSRAPWAERIGAIVLMVVGIAATSRLVHESISNGMMGFMLDVCHPRSVPRARHMGRGRAAALCGTAALMDARVDSARVRRVHHHSDRGHGRRRRIRSPLAMDANHRAAPPRAGSRPGHGLFSGQAGGPAAAPPAVEAPKQPPRSKLLINLPRCRRLPPMRRRRDARRLGREHDRGRCRFGGSEDRRVARLSRTGSRRHRSRRADRDRLVRVAAGRAVAPADRARLVVVRG